MDPLLIAKFFCQLLGIQPRDMQSTRMTLAARWTAPGVYVAGATGREPFKTLQVGYDHFFWQVDGFVQLGDEFEGDAGDLVRVDYNVEVKGEGWNNNIWDAPNCMGELLSIEGAGPGRSLLPGFLHFGEKSEIRLALTANELDGVWAGATRMLGIGLTGFKVANDLISEDVRAELIKRCAQPDPARAVAIAREVAEKAQ